MNPADTDRAAGFDITPGFEPFAQRNDIYRTDAQKCFGYRAPQNTDCAICIRVCPYNRDFSTRRARLWRWLAGTRARKVALWIDAKLGYGKRLAPSAWWRAPTPKGRA